MRESFDDTWQLLSSIETPDDSFGYENCHDLFKTASSVKNGTIVEIGSWYGRSSICLGATAGENGNIVYCIDPWLEKFSADIECVSRRKIFQKWRGSIEKSGHMESMKPLMGASIEVRKEWDERRQIDLLFIDGMHNFRDDTIEVTQELSDTFEIEGWKIKGVFYPINEKRKIRLPEFGVGVDYSAWAPLVKPGGYIAMHDIHADEWPAVARVWEEEIKSNRHLWHVESERHNMGIARKIAQVSI